MAKAILYKDFLTTINNNLKEALVTMKEDVEDREILPYQTGNLTDTAYVDTIKDGHYQLVYDPFDPEEKKHYAIDMYYISTLHPEWKLHHKNPPDPVNHHNKTHKKFNKDAKEKWLDDYIKNPNILADMYIKILKNNGYIS